METFQIPSLFEYDLTKLTSMPSGCGRFTVTTFVIEADQPYDPHHKISYPKKRFAFSNTVAISEELWLESKVIKRGRL